MSGYESLSPSADYGPDRGKRGDAEEMSRGLGRKRMIRHTRVEMREELQDWQARSAASLSKSYLDGSIESTQLGSQ